MNENAKSLTMKSRICRIISLLNIYGALMFCHANSATMTMSKIVNFEQNPFSGEKFQIQFENNAVRTLILIYQIIILMDKTIFFYIFHGFTKV